MFKSFDLESSYRDLSGYTRYIYVLRDTTFEKRLELLAAARVDIAQVIGKIYRSRKLPVESNLARYYYTVCYASSQPAIFPLVAKDWERLGKKFPKEYIWHLDCVRSHLNQLFWTFNGRPYKTHRLVSKS